MEEIIIAQHPHGRRNTQITSIKRDGGHTPGVNGGGGECALGSSEGETGEKKKDEM